MNTRRQFIVEGLMLTLLSMSPARASPDLSDEELDDLFEADAEPTPPGFQAAKEVERWSLLPARPQARWPLRSQSVDFRHISGKAPKVLVQPFELTSDTLRQLAYLNSFDLSKTKEHILFGLRGCSLAGKNSNHFVDAVRIVESTPDHIHPRCILGVWRPKHDDLWVTSGSTVPNIEYMYQMTKGGLPCNLLPTGLHRYRVGTHRASSRYPQFGAFQQVDPVPVLRNRNNLSFELPPVDRFDMSIFLVVADNIHAGMLENSPRPPYFSSAGCQVIPGGYSRDGLHRPYGAWSMFRERAGLKNWGPHSPPPNGAFADNGRMFLYMLLTGAEARIVSAGGADELGPRIRFGSSGKRVARLRQELRINSGGQSVDQQTMVALLRWQMDEFGYSDGVINPEVNITPHKNRS